jgi:hypothetical protein
LPGPLAAGVRQLVRERVRQFDPAGTGAKVGGVLAFGGVAMGTQRLEQGSRANGLTVLVALAGAHRDCGAREVDVLDAQVQRFEQAQARAVEQAADEAGRAGEKGEHGGHLGAVEDDRQMLPPVGAHQVVEPRQVEAERVAVEEEKRGEGLVLGGGRDPFVDGQVRQEGRDVGRAEFARVPAMVMEDEPPHPVGVRLLGARAVVARAQVAGESSSRRGSITLSECKATGARLQFRPGFHAPGPPTSEKR